MDIEQSIERRRNRNQSKIFVGGYIILIGVLALVDNLGFFDTHALLDFWPLVFIGIGGMKMVQSRHTGSMIVGGVLVLLGTAMILQHLGFIYFSLREWWPLGLIVLGGLVLSRGFWGHRHGRFGRHGRWGHHGETETLPLDENTLEMTAIMSGHNLKSDTQAFRGGELTAVMGGIELDLRRASIVDEAKLNVFVMWGGIEIKVPSDWSVVLNGMPILGGMVDKTVPPLNTGKRLVIEGEVIMGGLEIKN
jgi:hypothetical protein